MYLFSLSIFLIFVVQYITADLSNLNCTFNSQHKSWHKAMTLLKNLKLEGRMYSATDDNKVYKYYFGICANPIKNQGKDSEYYQAGLIQESIKDKKKTVVGRFNESSIMGGTDWIRLDYLGGKNYSTHCGAKNRNAYIMMTCDPVDTDGTLIVIEENTNRTNNCYYLFELHIASLCFTKANSMSVGDLLLILFFSSVLIYVVGGSFFNLLIKRTCSLDILPHRDSWRIFGNLVADGCDLVFRTRPTTTVTAYQQPPTNQAQRLQLDSDSDVDEFMLPM